MHSLRSYGRDKPVSDNAYTITSIYHGGTLRMYTSHRTQPTSAGGRPKYYMTQLRSFAMTDTAKTFRQGARAYRNARDWAKEQRNEAIEQANERASPVAAEAPVLAGDAAGDASGSLNEEDFEEPDSSTEELADYRPPAKRSSKRSKPSQIERMQRNAGESTDGSHSHGSAVIHSG
ncbi:uncharacterized protein BDZ99DRAFT_468645 [Mytilinidion resinicola]|uniref:Uncharacterized protein n=1 Tax=Mytilinidion resinicola TaxID=574789 RepID=A0A6A6Y2V6_9PEZI|nr:uncharacterized protein BDZ99DRAFT_468645 [Mytilinidion resinicola]KAF2803000.1 hypothetical protein BDZ99DRAFT_468645 [Mytilinidion resinicola]